MGAFLFNGCVGFILWSVIANRAEKYDESDGLPIEGNTRIEIIWTVIPFIIVMALAFYSIHVNGKLDTLGPQEQIRRRCRSITRNGCQSGPAQ